MGISFERMRCENMKKQIAALLITTMTIFYLSPFSFMAQEAGNPFTGQDSRREQAISMSMGKDLSGLPKEVSATVSSPGNNTSNNTGNNTSNSIDNTGNTTGKITGIQKVLETRTEAIPVSGQNTYIVQFKKNISLNQVYHCVSGYEYNLLADSESRLFKIRTGDISQFKNTYGSMTEYVGKSTQRKLAEIPNDTYFSEQWALTALELPDAWNYTKGVTGVKVAVIDSGFYRGHEDISNTAVLSGFNVCTGYAGVSTDAVGHGTMVTSIIAATANNSLGMTGACWNISVIPYKVADSRGDIDSSDVISAIRMAADAGCDVINMSLGGYDKDPAEQAAVDYAVAKGCIVVAASGNEGSADDPDCGKYSYPASNNGVISAGSVNSEKVHSDFSQHNDKVDVCAPGEEVLLATPDASDSYGIASGTSFSSPYVAAIAALARSQDPTISSEYFEQLIKETSTDLGEAARDVNYGWGLINAEEIVKKAVYPIVTGVDQNGVYNTDKTIKFNKGTALLNGNPFTSGTTITGNGNYTLTVTDGNSHTTTVNFIIDHNPLAVAGIENGAFYKTARTITFSNSTATLNGSPFSSGSTVNAEGEYTLVLTGTYGNTKTFHFYIDKTAPVITGVTEGASYNVRVKLEFNEGTGSLNGNTISNGAVVGTKGSYTLIVTDRAGNAATVHFSLAQNYAGSIEMPMTSNLTQWVLDEKNNILFAISESPNVLLCINALTLATEKTIPLEAAPTDIILSNGELFLALDAAGKILVLNPATCMVEKTIRTGRDPFSIARDGDFLFFTGTGSNREIRVIDLKTTSETIIPWSAAVYEPDLAVNTTGHILYVGETQLSGSDLYSYDILSKTILKNTREMTELGYVYPERPTLYNGKNVFYAGRAFEPADVNQFNGDYNMDQTVIFAKNGCVFTKTAVYEEDTHIRAGDFSAKIDLVEMSDNGTMYIYDQGNHCLAGFFNESGTITPEVVIERVSGTKAPEVPIVTESASTVEGELMLSMPFRLTAWEEDSERGLLYAIASNEKALFFIDSETLNIIKTIRFVSSPTDLEISNGKLYIAMYDANQIALVDIETLSLESIIHTRAGPFHLVVDGDQLFYIGTDQGCFFYQMNLITKKDIMIVGNFFHNSDLEINRVSHILYIAESGLSTNQLSYYDTREARISGGSSECIAYENSVLFDTKYVYYNGKAFDPADPKIVVATLTEKKDEKFLFAENGIIVSNLSCYYYDEAGFGKAADFEKPITLFEMSDKQDAFIYDETAGVILREAGPEYSPEVFGVEDGMNYLEPVTISFDEGTALLDGQPFTSGSTVSAPGTYHLIVTGENGLETTITFTIYAPQEDDNVPVVIPDANLLQGLMDNLADRDGDKTITRGEMRILPDYLFLNDYGIADLTGLEYAIHVKYLGLGQNSISDISPLSGLTSLTYLDLITNKISSIAPLGNLTQLTCLDVSENEITTITPLAGLKQLGADDGFLYLSDNQITDISPLSDLTLLSDLNLSRNPITDYRPIQNLTSLVYLCLSGNQMTDLSVLKNLLNIKYLILSNNNISDITALASLPDLEYLDLGNNNIEGISVLAGLPNLFYLDLLGNRIKNVAALRNNNNLSMLDLSDNEITDISPLQYLQLGYLDVSMNFLDLTFGSSDMLIINRIFSQNDGITLIYDPQKDLPPAPVITIAPYTKTPTNKDITVTASTDHGSLNAVSHTFTANGSFDFTATDIYGNKTVVRVTITNIDKTPPVITLAPYSTASTTGPVVVKASSNEGTLNATSHTFTENGSFTFTVTDAAGNTASKTVTISNIIKFTKGDINHDGKVDGLDLLKLKKFLLGQVTLTETERAAADVNSDGKADGLDLLKIKKYLLGQISL